ncbi:ankyrin repeat-containing domain protein [Daldinia vernicosa]|uniref:ankyrin repeat-containing domain protein n=1 Tax=Daldinia vernicosa TaxID=114800 RepID=UPI0020089011|nr:ankyrin repeat-containing domain protein [Daldinia vernicosa]KAI0844794.1 ankyrin repeat-containing domain protein [Daldinia vernicosa]
MASTRKTEADWLPYKHHINTMIHSEKRSNSDILEWLRSQNFHASKSQLEYQLQNWNIRRKLRKGQSEDIWRYVGHRVTKRRGRGKESKVVIDGKVYGAIEVAKEISRNQLSTLERIQQGDPIAPEGMAISVLSPHSSEMEVSWPYELPWFKFRLQLAFPISPRPSILTQCTNDILHLLTRHSIPGDIEGIVRRNHDDSPLVISHLASGMRCFMPEAYPDEILSRTQSIIQGLDNQRLEQLIMIIIFRLSNNLDTDELIEIWPTVLNLFHISGIMSKPLESKETTDITAIAVAEKLYRIAFQAGFHPNLQRPRDVQEGTRALIKWLLSSGQDPNVLVSIGSDTIDTSLHAAVLYQEVDLALVLLSKGADPNLIPKRYTVKQRLPLIIAISADEYAQRFDLIEALLRGGAELNAFDTAIGLYPLSAAIYRKDLSVVKLLLRYGAKIDGWCTLEDRLRLSPEEPIKGFTNIHTILGCAAGISPELDVFSIVRYLLFQLQEQYQIIDANRCILVETLLIAAGRGYNTVLTLLLDQGIDVNATNDLGYTALSLAAFWGHLHTCRMLLERGASVESWSWRYIYLGSTIKTPSPLHLAAYRDHLDVVKFLHQSGVSIDCDNHHYIGLGGHPFSIYNKSCNRKSLPLICVTPVGAAMFNSGISGTYRYLVSNGAMIPRWTAFEAAGSFKDFELLSFLLDNGQDPNEKGPGGVTLLESVLSTDTWTNEAEKSSRAKAARVLLDRGYKPAGREAVLAVILGDWELAERILCPDDYLHINDLYYSYRSRFTSQDQKWTMIHAACLSRDMAIIQKVLDLCPDAYNESALCLATLLACETRDKKAMDIVDQLLKRIPQQKMSMNIEMIALGIASWYENMQLFELLLGKITPSQVVRINQPNKGSLVFDPTVVCSLKPIGLKDPEGFVETSPLIFTLKSPQARALLLSRGCKADTRVLCSAIETGDLALVKELLSGNQQPFGRGILSKAISIGNMEMVKTLLEAGENINAKYYQPARRNAVEQHDNPLQTAIGKGHTGIWNLLLKNSPNVNAAAGLVYKGTALQIACRKGYLGLAKQLIDLGANVNPDRFAFGDLSALESAAENGRIDMIQLLLSSGAITTGKWRWHYLQAVAIAERNGHQAAASVLRLHRKWFAKDKALFAIIRNPNRPRRWDDNFDDHGGGGLFFGSKLKRIIEEVSETDSDDSEDKMSLMNAS